MAKHRKIELSIPKPCSEDWDKMTVDERGKFCSHCNKTVIDFSNYTDRELVDFFSKAKEKVCGNFYPTQLNRLIAIQEPSNTPFFHKVLIGASLAAGVAGTVSGQSSTPPSPVGLTVSGHIDSRAAIKSNVDTTRLVIKGKIVDAKTKMPLSDVNIKITLDSLHALSVSTDSLGQYSIGIPSGYFNMNVPIRLICYGYYSLEKVFTINQYNQEINLKMRKSRRKDYRVIGCVSF